MISNKILFGFVSMCMLMCVGDAFATELLFSGNRDTVIEVVPEKSTGLDKIYVLKDLKGVSISFQKSAYDNVLWTTFDKLGASYAQPLNNIQNIDEKSTLNSVVGDRGYIIESNQQRYIFWIVDYSENQLDVNDLVIDGNHDCESTIIDFKGSAKPIYFYTINGQQKILSRDIHLNYYNLVWNNDNSQFEQQNIVKNLSNISDKILVQPPLYCSSDFSISGDRFLNIWNEGIQYTSQIFKPHAINLETNIYSQDINNRPDNMIKIDMDQLGGSAPFTVQFTSYVTDGVAHIEWQMSNDADFNDVTYRITQQDFEYTFIRDGVTYVRCVASNSDGSCQQYSKTYVVNIGGSELKIPNAFSPDGDGINDEWKVGFRSILDFKCWIFDRTGHELFYFEDPARGWDGTYRNKLVKPGVYYYVIKASGADGKKYNKSGDINIISYRQSR